LSGAVLSHSPYLRAPETPAPDDSLFGKHLTCPQYLSGQSFASIAILATLGPKQLPDQYIVAGSTLLPVLAVLVRKEVT
jgi:hypothetical protein